MSIYFALMASLCFGIANVFTRRGLVTSNAITGSLLSIFITAATLWGMVPFFIPLSSFRTPAIWYFLAAGVFAPALGRILNFEGIQRIGVARAVPISNTYPMVASVLAVLIMGETWTLQNFFGTTLIIIGVIILSITHKAQAPWHKQDLIYPVMAAISFGVSSNFRKLGLLIEALPLMAATVAATSGLLMGIVALQVRGGPKVLSLGQKDCRWFLAAGFSNTAAMLFTFYALSFGNIVIVEPLIGANPVVAIILSTIFLRDLETVTFRIVVGAFFTVVGSILIMTV